MWLFFIIWFLLSMLLSCSHHMQQDYATPNWVEGLRSGEESLKVFNGSKVLYRRILTSENEEDAGEVCRKTLSLVEDDIRKESIPDLNVPFTVEHVYFDKKYKDCSVTVSMNRDFMQKIDEVKRIRDEFESEKNKLEAQYQEEMSKKASLEKDLSALKTFIMKNKDLLDKYSILLNQYQAARRSIASERESAKEFYLTGMHKETFATLIKRSVKISYVFESPCWRHFKTSSISIHGEFQVCWNNEHIVGACDSRNYRCYTRDP